MRAVALVNDLITASRILEAAARAGSEVVRVDSVDELPPAESVDMLLVDWEGRAEDWGERLADWRDGATTRVILFGPHTDLDAHVAARSARLGPMLARSKLMRDLNSLFGTPQIP